MFIFVAFYAFYTVFEYKAATKFAVVLS